jgi:uncharacterized protein (TIGR02001 family)
MRIATITGLILALSAGGAEAAELAGGWTLEGEVAVVSDYRFHGVSLSDNEPALQGGLTVSAPNGLYAYVWSSTIEDFGEGDGIELDGGFGWAFSVKGLDVDVSANLYAYPGASDANYWELPLSVTRATGAWSATLGGAYAPAQSGTGDRDNSYFYARAERELAFAQPVRVHALVGWEDGAFADSKIDWSLGAATDFGPIELGLAYVGADAADAGDAIVASLTARF